MLLGKIKIQYEGAICPVKPKREFSFSEFLLVRIPEESDSTVF